MTEVPRLLRCRSPAGVRSSLRPTPCVRHDAMCRSGAATSASVGPIGKSAGGFDGEVLAAAFDKIGQRRKIVFPKECNTGLLGGPQARNVKDAG